MKKDVGFAVSFFALVFTLALTILNGGCATKPVSSCPTVEQDPVSVCRAAEKCKKHKTSYNIGLTPGIGADLGAGATQPELPQNYTTENYNKCLDQNLADQKKQAAFREEAGTLTK